MSLLAGVGGILWRPTTCLTACFLFDNSSRCGRIWANFSAAIDFGPVTYRYDNQYTPPGRRTPIDYVGAF